MKITYLFELYALEEDIISLYVFFPYFQSFENYSV